METTPSKKISEFPNSAPPTPTPMVTFPPLTSPLPQSPNLSLEHATPPPASFALLLTPSQPPATSTTSPSPLHSDIIQLLMSQLTMLSQGMDFLLSQHAHHHVSTPPPPQPKQHGRDQDPLIPTADDCHSPISQSHSSNHSVIPNSDQYSGHLCPRQKEPQTPHRPFKHNPSPDNIHPHIQPIPTSLRPIGKKRLTHITIAPYF